MSELELNKLQFIQEMGLRAAIISAISRQPIYADDLSNEKKKLISNRWRNLLLSYKGKYQQHRNIGLNEFVNDVVVLKENMTSDDIKGYYKSPGFTLGRAQKSLTIFLKYLWLCGEISTPPACPIDRGILEEAIKKDNSIQRVNWTSLNDKTEYKKILDAIKLIADVKHEGIAVWELRKYNEDKID